MRGHLGDEDEKLPEVDKDDQAQPFVKPHLAISLFWPIMDFLSVTSGFVNFCFIYFLEKEGFVTYSSTI